MAIDGPTLLLHAYELAGRDAPERVPTDVDLRRAESAAYYALFHFVAWCAAAQVLRECTREDQFRFTRHFRHDHVKKVCNWVRQSPPAGLKSSIEDVQAVEDLVEVADAFCQLQEARHRADYDHLADFPREAVLADIERAENARLKLAALLQTREACLLLGHIAAAGALRT